MDRYRLRCFIAVLCFLVAVPAAATSFVAVSDEDLVDGAVLIVTGEVGGRSSCRRGDAPCTDVRIELDRSLKGLPGPSPLTVRLPGGVRDDGLGLHIFGAPRLAEGDRVLLFLRPDPDAGWRILHLMLGAFRQVETEEDAAWIRDLGETAEVIAPPRPALSRGSRAADSFEQWIADRVAGDARPADYFLPAETSVRPPADTTDVNSPTSESSGFTLVTSQGLFLRWFSFDAGIVEEWQAHEDGQPGLTLPQTLAAISEAAAAWSRSESRIRYALDSPPTNSQTGGLTTFDNTNTFVFENPNNNPGFGGDFSCASGGVLAIGGPWFTSTPQPWNGQSYIVIISADVVTNRGIECHLAGSGNPQRQAAQLFAHELGHTLGIAHSCGDPASPSCGNPLLNDALMRATIHNDLRGARLNDDDSAACEALYEQPCLGSMLRDGFESGDTAAWSASVP